MIVNEHVRDYINSLDGDLPAGLYELEQNALRENVPIIRRESQQLIRFLLRTGKPRRILELGTAVGFSSLLMAEYAPQAEIITVEKVKMRLKHAKENLAEAGNIILAVGDAQNILEFMCGDTELEPEEIYFKGSPYTYGSFGAAFGGRLPCSRQVFRQESCFDFVFLDAAKAQYLNYLPYIVRLLKKGGMLLTDNVLLGGSLAMSKYSVTRRDRTVHMRMREFLYRITHTEELETAVLSVADGMSVSVRQ